MPVVIAMPTSSAADIIPLLVVALFFSGPFAVILAAVFVKLSYRFSSDRRGRIINLLAGLFGAIPGSLLGEHLYWKAHDSMPAIVYFAGGATLGGISGITGVLLIRICMRHLQSRKLSE
ncbi:hypothetical protein [Symmachiella dynata]|uniref:hypothetical protein n=1 Tax=Symmachiella dynata TaxID=2527995 RepID=UPI0030EBC450